MLGTASSGNSGYSPPQMTIQSPVLALSLSFILSKHSFLMSSGKASRGNDRTARRRSGPRARSSVPKKSTPRQIPSASAAATKATPNGAVSIAERCGGSLQALKSDTTEYCWNAAFLLSR